MAHSVPNEPGGEPSLNLPEGLGQDLPKDGKIVAAMLRHMGITDYEPAVIDQLLEFVYKYVTDVLEEAKVYSEYSGKTTGSGQPAIDSKDVELAVSMMVGGKPKITPPRDVLLGLAAEKNATPLPAIKPGSGLKLPPDRYCLLQPNYKLKTNRQILVAKPKFDPVALAAGNLGGGSVGPGAGALARTGGGPMVTSVGLGGPSGGGMMGGAPGGGVDFGRGFPGVHAQPFQPPVNPMLSVNNQLNMQQNQLNQQGHGMLPRPSSSLGGGGGLGGPGSATGGFFTTGGGNPSPMSLDTMMDTSRIGGFQPNGGSSGAGDFAGGIPADPAPSSSGGMGTGGGYPSQQQPPAGGRSLFRVVTSEPPESRKRKGDDLMPFDPDEDDI